MEVRDSLKCNETVLMSLTHLITSAAAASKHLKIAPIESKYLLPFETFLYLQRDGAKNYLLADVQLYLLVLIKKKILKRALGFHLMTPEDF